jgi:hypothetical protein
LSFPVGTEPDSSVYEIDKERVLFVRAGANPSEYFSGPSDVPVESFVSEVKNRPKWSDAFEEIHRDDTLFGIPVFEGESMRPWMTWSMGMFEPCGSISRAQQSQTFYCMVPKHSLKCLFILLTKRIPNLPLMNISGLLAEQPCTSQPANLLLKWWSFYYRKGPIRTPEIYMDECLSWKPYYGVEWRTQRFF